MDPLLIAVGGFVLLLGLLVALRAKTGSKFEVKNSDIILALIPIALWMFLTGKVQEFGFGDFRISAAIKEASTSQVSAQVTKLPVENLKVDPKTGVGAISMLERQNTQVLSFQLGHGRYYGPAIYEYLSRLTHLRYLVFNDRDGSFYGLVDAHPITELVTRTRQQTSSVGGNFADDFAEWLNTSNNGEIERLPGFMSAKQALQPTADKTNVLRFMDSLDVQTLPVVDDGGKFVGILDRSKLTASILIDIAQKVEAVK